MLKRIDPAHSFELQDMTPSGGRDSNLPAIPSTEGQSAASNYFL